MLTSENGQSFFKDYEVTSLIALVEDKLGELDKGGLQGSNMVYAKKIEYETLKSKLQELKKVSV